MMKKRTKKDVIARINEIQLEGPLALMAGDKKKVKKLLREEKKLVKEFSRRVEAMLESIGCESEIGK